MMLCMFYQFRLRLATKPATVSAMPRLARHLTHCERCRNTHRRLIRLDAHLRAAPAEALSAQDCARIEASILSRLPLIAARSEQCRPVPHRRWTPRYAAVAAAALLLIAALLFVPSSPHHPLSDVPPETMTPIALWSESASLASEMTRLMRLPEQSFQAEVTRLTDDARRAVAFLLNCTPSDPSPAIHNGL